MSSTFFGNNNSIVAVAGGESAAGANTLAYTIVNNDEPNVSFTRSSSQFMSAPETTYNIQTNGGFTAVVRVRFMNTLGNERIFDFGPTGGPVDSLITLTRASVGTSFQAWIMNATDFTATLNGGTIVQNQWTNLVMRYISDVGFPKVAMTSDTSNGYISSTSGVFLNDPQYSSYRAFDQDPNTFWHSVEQFAPDLYNDSTGVYQGSTSTTVNGSPVLGEWIQIQLPVPIQLVGFVLTPRDGFSTDRSPQDFVIAGSNDPNLGWTNIATYSGQLFPTASPVQYTLAVVPTQAYLYYRMIITVVGGGATSGRNTVQIAEWSLQNALTKTFQLYQNGVLVASQTVGNELVNRTLGWNYLGYNIANNLYSSIDYAGLFVYDRALSDSEIASCLDYIQGRQAYTPTPPVELITIDSSNNTTSIFFYLTPEGDVGFPQSISGFLPLGTYTPEDLAIELTTVSGTGFFTYAFWTWDSATKRFTVTVNPSLSEQYMELRNDFGSTWLTTLGFVPSTVPYQTSYTAPNAPPGLDDPTVPKFTLIARDLGLADGANVATWGGFTQSTPANQPIFWRRFNNWVGLGSSVFSSNVLDIAYARNRWVAGGTGATNTLAYSDDGVSWTPSGTSIFSTSGNAIASSLTRWIAGGTGTTNALAYSTNGSSWTPLGKTTFDICTGVAWNARLSRWVAVGNRNTVNQTSTIAYSNDDGSTWTLVSPSPFTGTSGSAGYCVATAILSGANTLWVAGGENNSGGNSLAYSTDGITWTGNGNGMFSTACYGVAWNGNLWVAVGQGTSNSIATSLDGLVWTPRGKPAGVDIGRRVTWTGTYWLVAGEPASGGNGLAISYDGENWTGITRQGLFTTRGLGVASNFSV